MARKALLGNVTDNDLRLLRVFRAVVSCGGFAAAELELNINRSTISRHIKDLETRLGVTLCRRGRGGFSLTPEGEQVYASAQKIMIAMDEFQQDVKGLHQALTGHLSIAIFDKTASNPDCHIHRAFAAFDRRAPEVEPEICVEPINAIERGVMEGRYQLGIIPNHRPSSSLDYFKLFEEQMYLYCAREHPLFERAGRDLSAAEVRACRYVGIGYHSPNMEASRSIGLERHATAHDQEAVAHLVLSGRYIGYLPEHYADTFVAKGVMRPLLPDTFQYVCEFSAIVRRSPPPSQVVQALLDALVAAHREV
ncbi:LysR family transcriptional regulator [Halioglobus japonicus]|uniref:LysR family transcriptional regulator n=1 Tax=Halioglobus japonicus TaxID=930805 RepID=A0AAP8MFL5_9GAMM|nr:LysR family transcriptional regulator [Halioglobus japonicus]AQA18519.1 LysR family transcriptional regulator [Halioglobus japonicus]PLW86539.1 LysR family transcriptional regulator [Halioglobus japonicus]GHD12359.1 LysR family transcriptional regulator [Halioglobus japonicus]